MEGLTGKYHTIFRGFRFLEPWLQHGKFGEVVQKYRKKNSGPPYLTSWKRPRRVLYSVMMRSLITFSEKMEVSSSVTGNSKSLSNHRLRSLEKLELKLMIEMEHILMQEDLFWKQKARYK